MEDHGSVEVTERIDVDKNRIISFYVQDIVP